MRNLKDRSLLFEKQFVDNNLELDLLSHSEINFDNFTNEDAIFIVNQQHVGRIDLISHEVYRSSRYWWLIALRNNILDPVDDLYVGQELLIPSLIDYFNFYDRNIKVSTVGTDESFDKRAIP